MTMAFFHTGLIENRFFLLQLHYMVKLSMDSQVGSARDYFSGCVGGIQ